jgi:hypothetical protein
MITNIYTAVQEIMRKLKDSLTLRKFEVQSVAAQAKRLAAAGESKVNYITKQSIHYKFSTFSSTLRFNCLFFSVSLGNWGFDEP